MKKNVLLYNLDRNIFNDKSFNYININNLDESVIQDSILILGKSQLTQTLIKTFIKKKVTLIYYINNKKEIDELKTNDFLKFSKFNLGNNKELIAYVKNIYLDYNFFIINKVKLSELLKIDCLQFSKINFSKNKENYKRINEKIKPYCFYFPQFHHSKVNDNLFYENYTDSESLYNVIKNNVCSNILETPNNLLYDNLINYSCENDNIISNQIEVAKKIMDIKDFVYIIIGFSKTFLQVKIWFLKK